MALLLPQVLPSTTRIKYRGLADGRLDAAGCKWKRSAVHRQNGQTTSPPTQFGHRSPGSPLDPTKIRVCTHPWCITVADQAWEWIGLVMISAKALPHRGFPNCQTLQGPKGHPATVLVLKDGQVLCTSFRQAQWQRSGRLKVRGLYLYNPGIRTWQRSGAILACDYWTKDVVVGPSRP